MASQGIKIWNYIDDLFACVPAEKPDLTYNTLLKNLVTELRLPINEDKLVPPSDIKKKTFKIPGDKVKFMIKLNS